MDNREILTRFKNGTLERRHAVALLTGAPAAPPGPAARPAAAAAHPAPATATVPATGTVPAAGPRAAAADAGADADAGAEPCAVIALHGRFPQAADLEAFWQAALEGRDTSGPAPDGRRQGGDPAGPGHFLDAVDAFDPELFGIDPAEAALIDPQERLLLESAWQALEGAGYAGARLAGLTGADGAPRAVGVFTAVGPSARTAPDSPAGLAAAPAHAAGRLSQLLDLRGPSQSVDTGGSSFLTALHLALASLRAGECAAALVAAADLRLHPARQRPGSGEAVAAVLLKPLSAALADADPVHAVLLAGAVGHTGRGEPGPLRERLVRRALTAARVAAAEVGLTEDAETVAACVGEAGAATGAAALARAVLQLHRATRLPEPGGPAEPAPWTGPAPRRALVGVHPAQAPHAVVLLQEAPPAAGPPAPPGAPPRDRAGELVLLSAPTPAHLAATARRIADWLERPEAADHELSAVAGELRTGRAAMACRLALVAQDLPALAAALAGFAEHGQAPGVRTADLHAAPGHPLLLDGLDETLAYVEALWQGGRWEQLTRLWLGGLDVLTAAPAPGAGRVSSLPTSVLRPRPLGPASAAAQGGQR
ncbi:polyketide synthase [Streptomyces sp. NPDC006326]|uniref:beta-ketoacyl [acyl carrier protein] synthase domain-containing protein n=1 Tax=Streptomyces sp. NPDC006326 TaxID=3156752 RepID=UPI0033A8314F